MHADFPVVAAAPVPAPGPSHAAAVCLLLLRFETTVNDRNVWTRKDANGGHSVWCGLPPFFFFFRDLTQSELHLSTASLLLEGVRLLAIWSLRALFRQPLSCGALVNLLLVDRGGFDAARTSASVSTCRGRKVLVLVCRPMTVLAKRCFQR